MLSSNCQKTMESPRRENRSDKEIIGSAMENMASREDGKMNSTQTQNSKEEDQAAKNVKDDKKQGGGKQDDREEETESDKFHHAILSRKVNAPNCGG